MKRNVVLLACTYNIIVSFAVSDIVLILIFFFFSSRRRHTRLQGDWSSDVCSSDLSKSPRERAAMETLRRLHPRYEADVMAFVQADPARTARLALDVARLQAQAAHQPVVLAVLHDRAGGTVDRKSTRLNSSHLVISYAVFC